ncbi:hypothetical protein [Micromonospora humi]|uniref:Uncharacterized protein n=1 Tax=Micromonospora humi TaxID=745366 RepID=A0A1C5J3L5_9ACTN|nr:hypothetical protein [Micromonospora humi]SCG65053.1 hypothetical protein GA0070213_108185 [Micromonospora humi]
MDVDVLRCRWRHDLAVSPALAWLSIHLLLYLGVGATTLALWNRVPDLSLVDTLLLTLLGVMFVLLNPGAAAVGVAAACCLGVLRLLSGVRWYWFRVAAVLLFAVPFPLALLVAAGPATALPVAAFQLTAALLVVQPRERPDAWASRDPAMEDHRW